MGGPPRAGVAGHQRAARPPPQHSPAGGRLTVLEWFGGGGFGAQATATGAAIIGVEPFPMASLHVCAHEKHAQNIRHTRRRARRRARCRTLRSISSTSCSPIWPREPSQAPLIQRGFWVSWPCDEARRELRSPPIGPTSRLALENSRATRASLACGERRDWASLGGASPSATNKAIGIAADLAATCAHSR